jgi:tripartite-type tricarboxylate transporter receptor subunit TctC
VCLSSKTQAAYPDRPIRYIVPSAAGGGADSLARILAAELTKQLDQQVVVDNRAGASGGIGMEMLVRANPDGYTIGYGNTPLLAINRSLLSNCRTKAAAICNRLRVSRIRKICSPSRRHYP